MPSVVRYIDAEGSSGDIAERILDTLIILGLRVKMVTKNYVAATYGSFSALNPYNSAKDVAVTIHETGGRARIVISVDYTRYLVYGIVLLIIMLGIGLVLLDQANLSLKYLEECQRNPFIILVKQPPWLLQFLTDHIDDVDMVKTILGIIEISAYAVLFAVLVSTIYLITLPATANRLADKLAASITTRVTRKTNRVAKKRHQENAGKKETSLVLNSVKCGTAGYSTIICTINGENITMEHMEKALRFLGFDTYNAAPQILVGRKDGKTFASDFPSKKIDVRALISSRGESAKIIFETHGVMTSFNEKDAIWAERMLKDALLTQ